MRYFDVEVGETIYVGSGRSEVAVTVLSAKNETVRLQIRSREGTYIAQLQAGQSLKLPTIAA